MSTHSNIAKSLAALGHDARLSVFHLLVRAGNDGLTVGDISEHLSLAPSTLAHHLRALVDAGLVQQEKQGREVINRADFEAVERTVAFLTAECCQGVELRKSESAA